MELIFITGNKNKLEEARSILGKNIESKDIDLPEIQSLSAEEVAKDKARRAYEIIKKPVLVEDSGFYISAWNNFPGALIKWALKTIGIEKISDYIAGSADKLAVAEACLCLYDGNDYKIFSGKQNGIITIPKGSNGFGFDPIFMPEGFDKTLGEMSFEEKNRISMRKQAFTKLKEYLDEKNFER